MKERLRLLYLINSLGGGGAEVGMFRILKNLDRRKYASVVVALSPGVGEEGIPGRLSEHGIRVVRLGITSRLAATGSILKLLSLLRGERPDVLCGSLFHASILGRVLGRLSGVPVVLTWEHNENLGGPIRVALNRLTQRLADVVIADSDRVGDVVTRRLGVAPARLRSVIIGGLDLDEIPQPAPRSARAGVVIGSLGKLREQKGYPVLLAAMRLLLDRGLDNVSVEVAGAGPGEAALRAEILRLGLDAQCRLVGHRSDIWPFLAGLDVYVQPSLWEGLCIAVVEAMAMELPVVASGVGGITGSVVDGETGLLVAPGNAAALADRLDTLIRDPMLRAKLGRAGRERALRLYDARTMARAFEGVLDEAVLRVLGLSFDAGAGRWVRARAA
ncbi:MAG: glycosyltransferase [Candidatus Rokubacteria bacterium]|nr:glycosyltransferase [Candidatus Rokubacteria bacterium]